MGTWKEDNMLNKLKEAKQTYLYGNLLPEGKEFSEDFKKWLVAVTRFYEKNRRVIWNFCRDNDLPFADIDDRKIPRQTLLNTLIENDYPLAKEWVESHPMPEMYADSPNEPKSDDRDIKMYGIFNDGGNCFSTSYSRADNSKNWYWSTSDGETVAEFKARLKRQGERKAQANYNYYSSNSNYGVRVFKNVEDFKKACDKVGLHPNLKDTY